MFIKVRILNICGVIYESEAEMVVMPGEQGQLGVLYGHVNMIVKLTNGIIRILQNNANQEIKIDGGFAEITATNIEILI